MNNDQLRALYSGFFDEWCLGDELVERASAPLLLAAPESWSDGSRRLLVVGKETQGWGFDGGECGGVQFPPVPSMVRFLSEVDAVSALMCGYVVFDFARHSPRHRNSPFWRAYRLLGDKPGRVALWSNLLRFDVDGGSLIGKLTAAQRDDVLDLQRGLLRAEIELLSPHAVVFFTGPDYDFVILDEFAGAEFEPFEDFSERQFARVSAPSLPTESYRLYHPAYLNRDRRRWGWLERLSTSIG